MRIGAEAMTLSVRARGVQTPRSKMSSVVGEGPPPWDPTTLGLHLEQRRAIDAWRRSREGHCALPQRIAVPELDCICQPLFLNELKASPAFSCNI